MKSSLFSIRSLRTTFAVIAASLLLVTACSEFNDEPATPQSQQQGVVLGKDNPGIRRAIEAQERHTARLMENPNVVGTAVTATEDGRPAIMLLLRHEMPEQAFPKELDGIPVVREISGEIVAMKGKPGGGGTTGANHKTKQATPIQLGTSGGWTYDLANGYCCGGTLGSLIKFGDAQYILSNYHVLNADIVPGGNGQTAKNGDPVIQPGLIDVSCSAANAQNVATLADANAPSLPGSNVDCAIAQVSSGMVRTDGAILDIGVISNQTVAAYIGQPVKKSGRTTALTRSTVSGLNATISVVYDNECAGGTAFTKTFTGQIVINNRRSKFLAGGDSGSLMVEDVTSKPRAVGLLFAGSNTTAIANPIGDVLAHYPGAVMVGQ